jgi:hypothetical protein
MSNVKRVIADHLLHGKHRALLSEASGAQQTLLAKTGHAVKLLAGDHFIQIGYDGLTFRIQDASAGVSINNVPCSVGTVMPEFCVITINADSTRVFYLFDMSHPEVVL